MNCDWDFRWAQTKVKTFSPIYLNLPSSLFIYFHLRRQHSLLNGWAKNTNFWMALVFDWCLFCLLGEHLYLDFLFSFFFFYFLFFFFHFFSFFIFFLFFVCSFFAKSATTQIHQKRTQSLTTCVKINSNSSHSSVFAEVSVSFWHNANCTQMPSKIQVILFETNILNCILKWFPTQYEKINTFLFLNIKSLISISNVHTCVFTSRWFTSDRCSLRNAG